MKRLLSALLRNALTQPTPASHAHPHADLLSAQHIPARRWLSSTPLLAWSESTPRKEEATQNDAQQQQQQLGFASGKYDISQFTQDRYVHAMAVTVVMVHAYNMLC